ncbi:MAG: HAD family hydrolase [Treponema sp.]|nr:HAD family hydrolase [Treponema sp.]
MSTSSSAGIPSPKFSAVAFDLDGTLYPDFRLFCRLIPFSLRNHRLLGAMGKVRAYLRKSGAYEGDFYDLQARLMGEILNEAPDKIREKTDRLVYRGWEPLFRNIRLFPHARETLDAFRSAGIPMGLLSDFPPAKKLEYMNLAEYWDVALCSEAAGRLKPDPASFLDLAEKMGKNPQDMLYVGNKLGYDVKGAHAAGMKAALILPAWKKRPASPTPFFVFSDYRQLRDYVLH